MERVVSELQALGLSSYEARAYNALAINNPATGYELAKKSGVPLSRIYETLGRLQAQGLACCVSANPALYVPLPPEQFLSRVKQEFQERTGFLGTHFSKMAEKARFQFVWSITDSEDMMAKAVSMIDDAHECVYVSCWDQEFALLASHLESAADRGVKVFLIGHGDVHLTRGVCIRHEMDDSVLAERGREVFVVMDTREVLVGRASGEQPAAVWTENSSMVMIVREFIMHEVALWRLINECMSSTKPLSRDAIFHLLEENGVSV